MQKPVLEESFYWRGLAREQTGDLEGAISDLKKSVELNSNFAPGYEQLAAPWNPGALRELTGRKQ